MDGEKTQPAANRGALEWDFDMRREDGSLGLNHPRKARLDPGGPLETHRRFGESKHVVLLGRLGLKFRRHSP